MNLYTIKTLMSFKRICLAAFSLFTSAFAIANNHPAEDDIIRKTVNIEDFFRNVTIHGNISVVFTTEAPRMVIIEGKAKNISHIKATVKNSRLIIDARSAKNLAGTTVYISSSMVKSLNVNGDGTVTSDGIMRTKDLLITLNGNSLVHLASAEKGKIKVEAADGYELHKYNR